jgi:hypothetical protein
VYFRCYYLHDEFRNGSNLVQHILRDESINMSAIINKDESESKADAEFVPTSARASLDVAQCFYSWREIYPELELLLDNIEIIKEESRSIGQVRLCTQFIYSREFMIPNAPHSLSQHSGYPGQRTISIWETRSTTVANGLCSLSCTPSPPMIPQRRSGSAPRARTARRLCSC